MIHLVTGAPGSGKTTYAKEHMAEGDQLIDYDLISTATDSERVSRAKRLDMEEKAKDYTGGDVWITRSLPVAEDRAEFAQRIGVDKTYVLHTDAQTSHERAVQRDGDESHAQYISYWWKRFTPHVNDIIINPDKGDNMGDLAPETETTEADKAPETEAQNYEATKPVKEMTDAEQADYFKHYARKHESENKALLKRIEELENGQKSAIDEAVKTATEAQAKSFGEKLATTAVHAEAAKLGFINADDALRFIDMADLVTGADIDNTKISEALKAIAEERPYLVQAQEGTRKLSPRRIKRDGEPVDAGNSPKKRNASELLRDFTRNN